MTENTRDLSQFGYRELKIAGELLTAYTDEDDKDKTTILSTGVSIEFNPNSGNVFLVDEDYNVAMMNGEFLEDWFTYPNCGHEGFKDDMKHGEDNSECQEYLNKKEVNQ